MPKDWARGRRATTDSRIARNAAARRGRVHRRPATDRRLRVGGARFRPPEADDDWTAELAYAVGLAATDGCLSGDRKTVAQTSGDVESLETFRRCIQSNAPIRPNKGAWRVQVTDVGLYRWLQAVGLTPRKSLTLGPLRVPDRHFAHLVRGLLDGDGSILVSVVVPNPRRYPDHTYQRLRVQFHSASEGHASWLRDRIEERLGLKGWLGVRTKNRANPLYIVRYSKHASIALLNTLYADPSAPRLERKWQTWTTYRDLARSTRKWHRRKPI